MCNFISAIVIRKNGEIKVVTSDYSDSHSDILDSLGIKDTEKIPDFVKLELTPVDKTDSASLQNVESWIERVDQDNLPVWWTDAAREEAFNILRSKVKKMFITGEVDVIDKGRWILLEGAIIGEVRNARIVCMVGNSQIKILSGISEVCKMQDSSKINIMYNNSTVTRMYNNSEIGEMRNNAKVDTMYNDTAILEMCNFTVVREMYNRSQVGGMYNNTKVYTMFSDTIIGEMCDNTVVNRMYDRSKVSSIQDDAKIDERNNQI